MPKGVFDFMEQNTLIQNGEFNANRLLDLLRVTGKKYDLDKIKRAYE